MSSLLAVSGAVVRRGTRALLDGVSLSVDAGEVVALVGPNGAGKSTLLRAAAGDVRLDAGTVALLGRPLGEWSLADRARIRAVLPQESSLVFPFTALDVVLLGRAPYGGAAAPGAQVLARAALHAVGLDGFEARLYPTLSGGERQRVQLARAIAQIWSPGDALPAADGRRLLLLDEPTASLDLAQQHRALGIARRFARDGVGVLVVLHDLNVAVQHADRVVVLARGVVAASGPPAEVLVPDVVERVFGVRVVAISTGQRGAVLVPVVEP